MTLQNKLIDLEKEWGKFTCCYMRMGQILIDIQNEINMTYEIRETDNPNDPRG